MREREILGSGVVVKGFHNKYGGRTHIGSSEVQLAFLVN